VAAPVQDVAVNPPAPVAGTGGSDVLASLLGKLTADRPDTDTRLITKAYEAAAYWHQGQKRKSGDPYITHPVAVAAILADTGADDQMLCAALLHDVVADTAYTLAALRSEFGDEITDLIDATMALDAMQGDQVTAALSPANITATALPGGQRALVIKLADRLHNMRTLRHLPRDRQVHKSRQTLDVIVPVASALGMDAISSELQNLASATLRRHGQRPGTASGHLLAATAALLPAQARARWRDEWLGELHKLPTRRERLAFAMQIVLGIGRLAVTLYRPGAALKRVSSAILATAAAASSLVMGGWKAAVMIAAAILASLVVLMWILRSDDRTRRLAQLIHALRNTPPQAR
jgi:HD domain